MAICYLHLTCCRLRIIKLRQDERVNKPVEKSARHTRTCTCTRNRCYNRSGEFVSIEEIGYFTVSNKRSFRAKRLRIPSLSLITWQVGRDKRVLCNGTTRGLFLSLSDVRKDTEAPYAPTMQICWSCSNRMISIWNACTMIMWISICFTRIFAIYVINIDSKSIDF